MSTTHYLTTLSGSCVIFKLDTSIPSPSIEAGNIALSWDTIFFESRTIESGTWTFLLGQNVQPGDEYQVRVRVRRLNSSCVAQETIFDKTNLVLDDPGAYILDVPSVPAVSFDAGDLLELFVSTTGLNTPAGSRINYNNSNTRLIVPDSLGGGVPIEVMPVGVSTASFDLGVTLVGTHGQSGTIFDLTVLADLEFSSAGVSANTLHAEFGVFLELETGGVSDVTAALLDVILTPFPRVLPMSLDGRARWTQFKFEVDGTVDVLLAGFVLYVVTAGQLNVDEP